MGRRTHKGESGVVHLIHYEEKLATTAADAAPKALVSSQTKEIPFQAQDPGQEQD
ncbi:hypothetical protein SLEP1_g16707 [Rubroshorea leprosula]|uniref:Uncharacterized protein n=1 Tax=Rubroshorea leprosula TaxID=152421 RepID=A0AAV5J0T1_9ROSI|nr:hypothetical protein SLEP1_g16707 [Rubroshorea leprosula]